MRKNFTLFLFFVFMGTALLFSGCAEAPLAPTAPSRTANPRNKNGVLNIGTAADNKPFSFVSETGIVGEFAGVDIGLADEISRALYKEPKILKMDAEEFISALESGKADIIISTLTAVKEYEARVDYSDVYYTATLRIVTGGDSQIAGASDLKGKKIGVIEDYLGDEFMVNFSKGKDIQIKKFKNIIDAVEKITDGSVDAVVVDGVLARGMFEYSYMQFKVIEDNDTFEPVEYVAAVKKGNSELLKTTNEIISVSTDIIESYAIEYSGK